MTFGCLWSLSIRVMVRSPFESITTLRGDPGGVWVFAAIERLCRLEGGDGRTLGSVFFGKPLKIEFSRSLRSVVEEMEEMEEKIFFT